jgi:uncharacterized protein (TIGR02246 family)
MSDRSAIERLFEDVAAGWNAGSAHAIASAFVEDALMIGYDGREMRGKADIERSLRAVFGDHRVGRWVSIVRDVHFPVPEAAVLWAVTGWIQLGATEFPQGHQVLTAARARGAWRIVSLQTTPAAYHGSPERARALHDELIAAAGNLL